MIQLGMIGTSKIAAQFADAVKDSKAYEFAAIYSRKEDTAKAFCTEYPFKKIYTDLNELACDPEVDAVYIASPNSLHFSQALLMLTHKKHVICEKPVCVTIGECRQLFHTSRENNVILLEAMRPAFDPAFMAVREHLHKLGTIRRVSFSFCQYSSRYDNFKKGIIANVFNPKMGGGALLDIGIYPVYMLAFLFGQPEYVRCMDIRLNNGIDGMGEISAAYKNFIADISYSKITNSFVPSRIEGENGYMTINKISEPTEVIIHYNDKHSETIYKSEPINNMIYEAKAFAHMVKDHDAPEIYEKTSMAAMSVIEAAKEGGHSVSAE